MAAEIIDGKAVAAAIRGELEVELADLAAAGVRPGLATLSVGEDAGASIYRETIQRCCEGIGIRYAGEIFPPGTPIDVVLQKIAALNADPAVSGIIPLRPFSDRETEEAVLHAIHVNKDIDCVHPANMGDLALGSPRFVSATPAACMELLDRYLGAKGLDPWVALESAEACIVGRSGTVGKPLAFLVLSRNATVTVVHSYTSRAGRLAEYTGRADYLIVATGMPGLIGAEHVKSGAVVIDVGINYVAACPSCGAYSEGGSRLCGRCGSSLDGVRSGIVGDVKFDEVAEKAGAISPVPGGVGAVTNMMLMRNTLRAARVVAEGSCVSERSSAGRTI